MNIDTLKQQLTYVRAAYQNGTVNREDLDRALDIMEKELNAPPDQGKNDGTAKQFVRPFGNMNPNPPVPAGSNTPASPQPSSSVGNNPVPEQVGKSFTPGGTAEKTPQNQTARNKP